MALGRGLGELLGEVETAYGKSSGNSNSGVNKIEVSLIKPNPNQPRKIFDEEKLQELSSSRADLVSADLLVKLITLFLLFAHHVFAASEANTCFSGFFS